MEKFIDIVVDPDGTFHIDMDGYKGTECDVDLKKISQAIGGTVISQKKKQSYYSDNRVKVKGQ